MFSFFKLVFFIPSHHWVKWHHLRQLVWLLAAPSGPTKGSTTLFTYAVVLPDTCNHTLMCKIGGVHTNSTSFYIQNIQPNWPEHRCVTIILAFVLISLLRAERGLQSEGSLLWEPPQPVFFRLCVTGLVLQTLSVLSMTRYQLWQKIPASLLNPPWKEKSLFFDLLIFHKITEYLFTKKI